MFRRNLVSQLSLILLRIIIVVNRVGHFSWVPITFSTGEIVVAIGFSLWVGIVVRQFRTEFFNTIIHFCPQRCPILLIPFLVVIETIRFVIRPITLRIRIVANLSIGLLLIRILSNNLARTSYLLIVGCVFIIIYETFVGLIQRYIFSLLIMLYGE